MAQVADDYQEKPDAKNGFRCRECDNVHDITDLFLWSGCKHEYGRGCVLFCIQSQLYHKQLPTCTVDNCNKLLLEDAASIILPQEILMEFYQTHNDYQNPQNQIKTLDDEKNSRSQYVSLKQSNDTDSSSDGLGDVINGTQIDYRIKTDPVDDSSDAEITYNQTEQEPLLNNGHFNRLNTYGINSNNREPFECILCKNKHINDQRFEWTKCKCLYGRQCAENMIIEWLFKQDIPKCVKCKTHLELYDAVNVLQFDELQVFKEIYALKASLESFNAEQQQNENENEADINSNQKTQNNENEVSNPSENKPNASISDQTEKDTTNQKEEKFENEIKIDQNNNDKQNQLQPSVLMLPDNNYQALIPMDDDFIDANGIVLNAKKEAELQKNNVFYCSRCKNIIQLEQNPNNGKYIPNKCAHVSCKQCAKKHTKHEMEILQCIPTCQICSRTILDTDLIEIWGKYEATKLMDVLFKEKSLKLPPANPAIAAALTDTTTEPATAGVDDINDRQNNDRLEVNNDKNNVEEKAKQNENINIDENGYGYCMTNNCNKKGLLSTEKNEGSRLDCMYCGIVWCVKCGVEWHLGQTCEQYRNELHATDDVINALQQEQENMVFDTYDDIYNGYYDKNEQQFQEMYKKKGWKTCPVCFATYDKEGGCNRMKCQCGISFCWMCESIVDANGNDNHYDKGICKLNDD